MGVGQALCFSESHETVPVVAIEAVLRAHPQESGAILQTTWTARF